MNLSPDLEPRFLALGFSEAEASVYLTLLSSGDANGSRLSAACGLARTTTYAALESLLRRGAVLQTLGEPRTFRARPPSLLFPELGKRAAEDAASLAQALAPLESAPARGDVWNVADEAALLSKAQSLVEGAQREVLINTDWYMDRLGQSLEEAAARGVRVFHFAFCGGPDLRGGRTIRKFFPGMPGAPGALPAGEIEARRSSSRHRLMLVADMAEAIVASREPSGLVFGVATSDDLLVHVTAEHIHHDIYLALLAERQQRDIIDGEVKIGSLLETERR